MQNSSQLINPSTGLPFNENDSLAGAPIALNQFPALNDEEVEVLRLTAEKSLQAGHHPQTGVAFPLQAMIQIVVLIDELKARVAELESQDRDARTGEE